MRLWLALLIGCSAPAPRAPARVRPSDAIHVEQRPGEARVPAYTLDISASGLVTFTGGDCTKQPGTRTFQLPAAAHADAVAAFTQHHFAQLAPHYPDFETAAVSPFITISTEHAGTTRSVVALGEFAPPELLALQDRLLDLAEVHASIPAWRSPPHERCAGTM